MYFEVWIRTHNNRLSSALKLKAKCEAAFNVEVKILNTGAASITYSEKFVACLHSNLLKHTRPYVLILEDDMLISKSAPLVLAEMQTRVCTWFSVPSSAALSNSIQCSPQSYRLENFSKLSYSGAILLDAQVLKDFVGYYMLNAHDRLVPNFDVALSSYLKSRFGHVILHPGVFGSNPKLCSSIAGSAVELPFRAPVDYTDLDPLFDAKHVL